MFMVQYPLPIEFTRYTHRAQRTFTVTSLTQTCFNPARTSALRGVYNPCCHKQRKGLLSNLAITSCQVFGYG